MSEEKTSHEERFATSTSYHGMAHIYDGHTPKSRRWLWLTLTIVATAGCISQCIIIIYNASLLPSRIVTNTVLQNQSIFPSVTICNTNDYDRSALNSTDFIHLSTVVDSIYGYVIPPKQLKAATDYLTNQYGENFDYELFTRNAGHKLSNMLLSCTWMGNPCSTKDFVSITTATGSCFTFNPGKYDINHDVDSYPLI